MLNSSLPEVIGPERRRWRTHAEATLLIEASPERLYDLVADVASASARSEEVQGCVWLAGPPPGTVGSRFRGRNRAGVFRWSRVCEVVTAVRGEEFAFRVVPERFDPLRRDSSVWGYLFEAEETGTQVTHYYTLTKPPYPWLLAFYGIVMPHHRDPRLALRHTLEQLTLARLTPL
ncbi:MAG: SRPBCC family protein [Ornithinibacter sp.]